MTDMHKPKTAAEEFEEVLQMVEELVDAAVGADFPLRQVLVRQNLESVALQRAAGLLLGGENALAFEFVFLAAAAAGSMIMVEAVDPEVIELQVEILRKVEANREQFCRVGGAGRMTLEEIEALAPDELGSEGHTA